MNKLVLALATAAIFGLSTAAFAQNPTLSTTTPSMQSHVRAPQAKAPVAHKTRANNRQGTNKAVVAHRYNRHHKLLHARHHDHGKNVVVKHARANTTPKSKASS